MGLARPSLFTPVFFFNISFLNSATYFIFNLCLFMQGLCFVNMRMLPGVVKMKLIILTLILKLMQLFVVKNLLSEWFAIFLTPPSQTKTLLKWPNKFLYGGSCDCCRHFFKTVLLSNPWIPMHTGSGRRYSYFKNSA